MRMRAWLLCAAVAGGAGCGGDDGGPSGPPECSGAIYDPCDTEHDCMSSSCQNFTSALRVCSQTCTPGGSTCPPLSDGTAVTCTANGVCMPPAANDCVR